MTLADLIEKALGEERFKKVKGHKFSDAARSVMGEEKFSRMKDSLYNILVEHEYSSERVQKAARKSYEILKELEKETYYGFTVDAVAQNLVSLVYIFNDKYMARQSWKGAVGTRINAAVGNTITGRPYGGWQDYIITKADELFNISNDPNKIRKFFKSWGTKTFAFGTGQSWLYALFLLGGNWFAGEPTDYGDLARGVATLTVLAPLLGPISDKAYQYIRKQFGLPAVPEYRAAREKQIESSTINTKIE